MATVIIERNSVNWLRINDSPRFDLARLSSFASLSTYINDLTIETFEVKHISNGLLHTIHRVFADFNLSSIPIGSTITEIKVYLWVRDPSIDRFYVVPGGQSALAGDVSDYSRYPIDDFIYYGNFYPNSSGLVEFTLNESLILFPVGGTEYFSIGFLQIGDFDDGPNLQSYFSFYTENNGIRYPYLEITYTGPSGFIQNVSGVSNASINSIDGVNKTTIFSVSGSQ